MTFLLVVAYVAAIVLANMLVAAFGPAVVAINAFFLIGFDMVVRDVLHTRLSFKAMLCVIATASVASFALNPAAGIIAVASTSAFVLASLTNWVVFARAKGEWLARSIKSNTLAALVDSVVFPLIAFGALLPAVVFAQFVAKTVGAAVWGWLFSKAPYEH